MGAKKCLFLYSFLICWVKTTKLKIWSFVHRHSYYLLPSLHCEVYTPSLPSVPPSISVILLQPWSYLISIICDNDIKTDLYQEIIICYSDHNLGIVLILLFASVDFPPTPLQLPYPPLSTPPHLPHPSLSQLFLSISIPSPQSHITVHCAANKVVLAGELFAWLDVHWYAPIYKSLFVKIVSLAIFSVKETTCFMFVYFVKIPSGLASDRLLTCSN